MTAKHKTRTARAFSALVLALLMIIAMLPMTPRQVKAEDTSHLIINVEQAIYTGLNSKSQILAGHEVLFDCAQVMGLNSTLWQIAQEDEWMESVTFGILKSNGETIELTPTDGRCSFVAPVEDAELVLNYKITVTVNATGEVYESNTGFTVVNIPMCTLTLQVEGQGTIEASRYEVPRGEEIALTITPAEGWFFYKLTDVSGDWNIPAGKKNIICIWDPEVTIKAVFKEQGTAGFCGRDNEEDAEWEYDIETKTLTVTGTGAIADEAFKNTNQWDSLLHVVIGEGITEIGNRAFSGCSNLISVDLPQGITDIHDNAFYNCKKLETIDLPQELKTIGSYAFYTCEKLVQVDLPDGLTTLGEDAFAYSGLTEITVPESVTEMGIHVFYECFSLRTARIDAPIQVLPACTFYRCKQLNSVTLPDTLTTLGYEAFALCHSLQTIDLPAGITTFDECVFYQNYGIRSITIPDGVTDVPDSTFWKCSYLQSVELPAGLKTIGNNAFSYCSQLASIEIPETLISLDFDAFSYCSSLQTIDLPAGITVIPRQCFSGCSKLASVTMRGDVTAIGEKAFGSCSSLSQITLPSKITEIPSYCFENCTSLESINIPAGVTNIKYGAFWGAGLKSVELPEVLEKLGMYAFSNTKLEGTLIIPAGVTEIEYSAFYNVPVSTIDNRSAVEIPLSDILVRNSTDKFINSAGEEVEIIGQGVFTRKTAEPEKPDPVQVAVPTGKTLTFTGKAQTGVAAGEYYSITGNKGTNAGTYKATLSLIDSENYVWADGTTADKTVSWKISPASLSKATVANIAALTYTGKERKPSVTVKFGTITLKNGTDYTVVYSNNKYAGTAKATIKGAGNYTGSIVKKFTIKPATNPLTVKAKSPSPVVKYTTLKKKNVAIAAKNAVTASKAKGTVTYSKVSGPKKISVAKSGKITVTKGLAKGTYKVKIKVIAAGGTNYKKGSKTITIKVIVK